MTRMRLIGAALAAVLGCTTMALAADEPASRPQRERRPQGDRMAPGPRAMPGEQGPTIREVVQAVNSLQLTPEQREQVEKILQANRKAAEEFRTQHAAEFQSLREQMEQARKNNDEAAMRATREKLVALERQQMELGLKDLRKQLEGVLTKEQMQQVERRVGPEGRFHNFLEQVKKLDLSAEQKGKIEAIVNEAQAAKGEWIGATRKITEVLTEEQRQQLRRRMAESRPGPDAGGPGVPGLEGLRELNLTPEQKAKIEDIMKDARAKAEAATEPAAKREIMRNAREKIRDGVLTGEQRQKWQEREPMRREGPPRRERNGGPTSEPTGAR